MADPYNSSPQISARTLTLGDTNGADEQWVGDVPGELVLSPDRKTLYVQYTGVNTLKMVDIAGERVTGTVELAEPVQGMALNPANHTIYAAANGSSNLVAIDTTTNKVADRVRSVRLIIWGSSLNALSGWRYASSARIVFRPSHRPCQRARKRT